MRIALQNPKKSVLTGRACELIMVWFSTGAQEPVMLLVRAVAARRFELVRVSERGVRVLRRFACCEDAVKLWNEMEQELRRLNAPGDEGHGLEASRLAWLLGSVRR